jgi:carbon storage regulator
MLILSRRVDETIAIGDTITVRVLSINEGHVKLGIDAPKHIAVYRSEIYDLVQQLNKEAASAARSVALKAAEKIGRSSASGTSQTSEQHVTH